MSITITRDWMDFVDREITSGGFRSHDKLSPKRCGFFVAAKKNWTSYGAIFKSGSNNWSGKNSQRSHRPRSRRHWPTGSSRAVVAYRSVGATNRSRDIADWTTLHPSGVSSSSCRRAASSGGYLPGQVASRRPTPIMSRRWTWSLRRNDVSFILTSDSRFSTRNA